MPEEKKAVGGIQKEPSEPKPVHAKVIMEIVPELEKVLVIKVDPVGKESLFEFSYERLGRELEFKGPLPVQVRTYWDEIVAGVKAGIHLQKKVK